MSIKIKNIANKQIFQPKNSAGLTQQLIDTSASPLVMNASIKDHIDMFEKLKEFIRVDTEEEISALENKYVSKAYEDLYLRGVNPIRAEILGTTEFVELSPGIQDDSLDTNIINLNYGTGGSIKVNQVMRLIDLQRIIRKTILKISGDFLEEYIGFDNDSQQKAISYLHKTLKENIDTLKDHKSNIQLIVESLIELTVNDTGSSALPSINRGKNLKRVKADRDQIKKSIKEAGLGVPRKTEKEKASTVKRRLKSFSSERQAAKKMNEENSQYYASLARFVVFDYIIQNSISFLVGVSNLKSRLKDAISIMHTDLEPLERQSQTDTGAVSTTVTGVPYATAIQDNSLDNVVSPADSHSAVTFIELSSFLSKHVTRTLNESNEERYSLASVINLDLSDKEEEKFGSNRQMMLSLFAGLLETISFSSLEVESKFIEKNIFTAGVEKSLASSIKSLKGISLSGMVNEVSRLGKTLAPDSPELLSEFNLQKIFGSFDNKNKALDELVAAISFDQVSGLNVNSLNLDKKLNLINSNRFDADSITLKPTESPVIDYFNKAFFNATGDSAPSWENSINIGNYNLSNYMNSDNLGSYINNRFNVKEKDNVKYVPHEFSYEDNTRTDQTYLTAADFFFTEGLASENFSFSEMRKEAKLIKDDSNLIMLDLIRIFGLDFDDNGDAEHNSFFGMSKDTNPLRYFYSHCEALGKQINVAIEDLEKHMYIATPVIHAGDLSDMDHLVNVIKATFFGSLTNERGLGIVLNQEDENASDKKIKAAIKILDDQSKNNLELAWTKIWQFDLASLLKGGDPSDSLSFDSRKYSTSNTKMTTLITKGSFKLHNEKVGEWDHDYKTSVIGGGKKSSSGIDVDDASEKTNDENVDNILRERLYVDTTNFLDSGLDFIGNIAAGLGSGLLSFGTLAAAVQTFMGGSFFSPAIVALAGSIGGLVTIIIAAIAAATFLTLGVISAINTAEELRTTGNQSGSGFSGSGLFSFAMIVNAFIIPKDSQISGSDSEEEAGKKIDKIAKTGFGAPPGDLFLFNAKSGSDKYDIEWNDDHGLFGGIFKTNTPQRYTLLFTYFASIMNDALCIQYKSGDAQLYVDAYAAQWKGLADALQRKPRDASYSSGGSKSNCFDAYDHAYTTTRLRIAGTRNVIKNRRAKILKPLQFMIQNSKEINRVTRNIRAYLSGNSSKLTSGELVAIEFLFQNGYLDNGTTFLNEGVPGYLSNFYQKNFALDFRSDEDENSNPEGISVFPFNKAENYDIRSLKLMAKVFSQPGYGFTTSEKAGKNTILHIGIPAGLLNALRFEAYSKTSEIEYFFSSNIVIHITKVNKLNPSIKYHAKSYVFNTRKYIQEFKDNQKRYDVISKPGEFSLPNHIAKYDDTWTFEQIISNIEIMTANQISKEYGIGIEGIKKTNNESNEDIYDDDIYKCMLENHIFDYFSKLYLESTVGIDMSEINFQINRDNLYKGEVDMSARSTYEEMVQEIIARYPSANVNQELAQELFRVANTAKNSIYFSSEERAKSIIGTPCFERVFSIPMNEKCFALKNDFYNIHSSQVYFSDANIDLSPRVGIPVAFNRIRNGSSGSTVREYKVSCDPKKTDVSSFVVEIGILKSRNT